MVDTAIPILPSPTSPKISSPTTDLASEADRIKKEWESKNKSCIHNNGGAQLAKMINFKFGGSSIPSLSLALEMDAAPATDSDSSRSRPATSTSSSAAHESVSSPSRTSISELEKCSELDFPSSCELSHTNGLSPSLSGAIDPSMLPLPPSPSPSRVHGDALSVISSISKASRHENAGLNGGLNSSEARAPRPPLPSSSSTGEADASLRLSTLDTPRVLTAAPPPPVISLSPPDPSSEEMNSSKVSQPDCASNLDVDAGTIASLTITRTPSLSSDSCIPASSMTLASLPEPSSDNPSQDIPVISEVSDDDLIGLVAKFGFNYDGLDVVHEEPEMLSASGSTALRSGSLRSGRSAPKAARSRSASRTRGPLKVDDGGVVLEGGETNGGNLAVQEAEAVKRLPDPPSDEGAVEQPESSAAAVAPSIPKLPLKRGMTQGGGEKKKGVFNRFKRSNTTSAIPVADTTKQSPLPPFRAKRSMTVLGSVRRRVVSTLTSRSSLDPEGSDKRFDASPYPPSPTSAPSVFKSIRSVGNRSVSPAGGQSTRGLSPVRQPVAPTMHNQASIAFQTNAIEDEETRRMAELAFLS